MRNKIKAIALFGAVLLCNSAATAQDGLRHELSAQGTGFLTKDSAGSGIAQHSTDSGGYLLGYRIHLSRWLAADATHGYARITHQNSTPGGTFHVQANAHQTMGALVLRVPLRVARTEAYVLGGGGALNFDPTGKQGGFVVGAERQTKVAGLYGGGANVHLSPHVFLRMEYRFLVYKRPDFGLGVLNSGACAHTGQPSAGVAIRF